SRVSKSAACRGRNGCPLRRPKKARLRSTCSGPDVMSNEVYADCVNLSAMQSSLRRLRELICDAMKCPAFAGHDNSNLSEWKGSESAAQLLDQIGPLPGEAAVLFRRAAEMAVGGGAAIDWPVELERAADVGR